VFLLSVTTDPEVDRPKVLKSYAERYQAEFSNWSFLTGDVRALTAVWKNFGVKVERKARGLVNHTSLTAVIQSSAAAMGIIIMLASAGVIGLCQR